MSRRIACCLLLTLFTLGTSAAPANTGLPDYLDGLDALEAAKYTDADAAFSKALDADEDNGSFWLARGVARTLQEKLKEAEKDLLRASRLDARNEEVRMWHASVVAMQGDFARAPAIFPEATRNEEFNAVRTMSRHYGTLAFRQQMARNDPGAVVGAEPAAERDAAKRTFGELAAAFAARAKAATPAVGPLLLERGKQRLARRDYAGAFADLSRVLATNPNQPQVLLPIAACNAHLGAPALARKQFTAVLTTEPENGPAYAGRAVVAAMMGDTPRSAADVKAGESLDPAAAKAAEEEIKSLRTATVAPAKLEDLAAMVDALEKATRKGISETDLSAQADAIVQGANAHRKYADETYVERRRQLIAGTRTIPTSAASLADLGEFLFRQASMVRGEAVEPRAEFQTYRPQTKDSQATEMAQAEQVLDEAIKIDPKNVKALTFKGACLAWRLQYDEAETVMKTALAIDTTYAPLLDVFSQLLDHAAGVKSAAAAALRSPTSWSTLDYIYTRYPSQAELRQADEYDAQAQRLWALAEQYLQNAAKLHAGKRDGFYYEGIIARRHGDPQASRAAFEKCVELSPDDVQALDQLSTLYGQLGMQKEAFITQARAINLSHTTSGPMLRYAWTQIGRTAWKASKEACRAAIALDPADPRGPAYLGAIYEADDQPEDATAWYRVAAAIEHARGMLNASTFDPKSTATISPDACGFLIELNLRLGKQALAANQNDAALLAFRLCVSLTDHVDKIERFRKIAGSTIPKPIMDPQANAPLLPEADSIFDMAAWARLGLADALLTMGKRDEAETMYRRNVNLERQKPPTIDAGNGFREPEARSVLKLVKLLIAKTDINTAFELSNKGLPWGLPKPLEEEWRQMQDQVRQMKNKQMEEPGDPRYRQPPTPPRRGTTPR
jgi:tetratricopeptide (TPR) repeat protein